MSLREQLSPLSRAKSRAGGSGARRHFAWSSIALGTLLASISLSACAPSAGDVAAQHKAQLDREVQTASASLHVPPSMLAPIVTREQQVAAQTKSTDSSYQQATAAYTQLYQQVLNIEHTPIPTLRAQAQHDLNQFSAAVKNVQAQGFNEAAAYQNNLNQAASQFASAKTAKDYFSVDTQVQQQLAAVNELSPTYQKMTTLDGLVQAQQHVLVPPAAQPHPLECAQGQADQYWYTDTAITVQPQATATASPDDTQWHAQDLALFRTASSAQDYQALQTVVDAQTVQLSADTLQLLPTEATQLLQKFKSDVQAYQQDGGTNQTYQQQLTQDEQRLAGAELADYAALMQTVQQQSQALQFPLLKAKTNHDLATLKQLVAQGQAKTQIDPANGQAYPDAYEYADPHTGIGDAEARLANAQTIQDYQDVDREILMFSNNLQAMLQNLNDPTPSTQPHQTDLNLIKYYGVQPDKVIVVSLREQAARMYDNGQLVKSFPVTTGAPDLPSVAGIHCVLLKQQNTVFISPDPPGSPNYYAPTPIHFAMMYSYYGYFLHDAWWRSWFGKYSNLPHYDPAAFNGGSHGCINISLSNAAWLYSWVDTGTPVIVY